MKQLYFVLFLLTIGKISLGQSNCATAVPITSVPYNSGALTTCGTGNDYTGGTLCASWGGNGEDYVFALQVTSAPVTYSITLSGGSSGKVASVHTACPPSAANAIGCITAIQENGYNGTANIQFPTNGTYYIVVDSYWDYPHETYPGASCATFNLSLTQLTTFAPNDECSTAVTIIADTAQTCGTYVSSSTVNATQSNILPGADDDVWFKFVATSTAHTVELHDVSPNVPMTHHIYTPHPVTPPCTNLGNFAGGYGSGTKTITYGFVPGQTYYLRVYTSGTHHANFKVCVYGAPPKPSNDECSGAIDLPVGSNNYCTAPVRGSTYGATESIGGQTGCMNPDETDDDVWYSFTATNTSHVVRLTNVTGRIAVALYSGNCSGFTHMSCNEETLVANGLTPGTKCYLRVFTPHPWNTNTADFDICIGLPPANDQCANASTLAVSNTACSDPVRGSTAGATASTETAPSCNAGGVSDDVWYKFVATATTHTVSISRPDVTSIAAIGPVVIAAYSGACGTLTQLAGACRTSNDGGMVLTGLTAGNTYYLRVYTADADQNKVMDFDICVSVLPSNDECAGAIVLNTGGTALRGTTTGATQSGIPGNTACIDNAHNDDVWYAFTATATTHTVAVTEADISVMAAVYSGACGSLSLLSGGCAQGGVTLNGLTIGQTYYVRVYSTSTVAGVYTNFSIRVLSAPAANNECNNAVTINGNTAGSTLGATQSMAPEACGTTTASSAEDVWFQFTADHNGSVVLKVTNPSQDYDPVLAVYNGTCGSMTLMACANAAGRNSNESVTVYNLVAGTTYYARVYGYDGVPGTFSISMYGSALPVELIAFSGYRLDAHNIIKWTTATEINNAGFELQRSEDAISFKSIAFVATKAGNGTSSSPLHYQYADEAPSGTSYYRLKQVDKDGRTWYSQVITVKGGDRAGVSIIAVYPNPSKTDINLKLFSDKASDIRVRLIDLAGREMMEHKSHLPKGESQLTLPTGTLPAGTYILHVYSAEGIMTGGRKIIKLK